MDVSVEKRGRELEEGEGDSVGVCERRRIAEAKDVVLHLEGENGKRSLKIHGEGKKRVRRVDGIDAGR